RHRDRVELLGHRLLFAWDRLENKEQGRIRDLSAGVRTASDKNMDRQVFRAAQAAKALEALSPLAVLSRGYSLVMDERGHAVTAGSRLDKGDQGDLVFKDGQVGCEGVRPLA
ncbi:MAG: hypothetical protein GX819_05580, partial [Clostridiaceae bacterium]|nr:hypothetical protein [Clostridiaceae bacterium]